VWTRSHFDQRTAQGKKWLLAGAAMDPIIAAGRRAKQNGYPV